MTSHLSSTLALLLFPFVSCGLSQLACADERPIRFNRDIRPILSDKCFACHGPDAESVAGDLRLDLSESAVDNGAITPGVPGDSPLIDRIDSSDENTVMPPPHSHKTLTSVEKDLLTRWIEEGAQYEPHWAYTSLRRPTPPSPLDSDWCRNDIDCFVAARLESEGAARVARADRVTLIRRLSLDLTGIAPTPAEVDAFLDDHSEHAYRELVDRLLESPRFGERMAMYWLDLVRYADTVGYHGDQDVSQSPYRDYVIDAFNANMPFDQFVREQLAGDLLPGATPAQQIASGYNRLNQTTEEGGAQAKEYLAIYFADRVRNVSQVFMGATVGCAQCHDHKYDPYTAKDFYSLGAFFADLDERGVYGARQRPPTIPVFTADQQAHLDQHDQRLAQLNSERLSRQQQLAAAQPIWENQARAQLDQTRDKTTVWIEDSQDTGGQSSESWEFIGHDQGPVYSGTHARRQSSSGLVQHVVLGAKTTIPITETTRFYTWVYLDPGNPPQAVMLQFHDGSWDHRAVWGSDAIKYGKRAESWAGYHRAGDLPQTGQWVRLEVRAADVGLKPGSTVAGQAWTQFGGLTYWDHTAWIESDSMPEDIAQALSQPVDGRSMEQAQMLTAYYLAQSQPIIDIDQQIAAEQTARQTIVNTATTVMVSKAVTPRPIRVLPRGNWMDDSGEIVEPAIPEFLGSLEIDSPRATRLDLANWLCRQDNPLTSRTFVNRIWYLMFGRGISTSVDDLGGQGTYPSHPDLLDWLAVEFVESGWDVKHLIRTIVSSSAYQQSSRPTESLRASDPYNELFARQGRFRIDAEMVRDNALAVSGLLVEHRGGPSVKPYQPEGYYDHLNFPKRTYVAETSSNQFRRGLYTHWQRTFLHPMLKAFDAPSREECTAARSRSNTPLQALTLLNDPTFVEAARVFAARIMREGGKTTAERIQWAYREALSHKPAPEIAEELEKLSIEHIHSYTEQHVDAEDLVATGVSPPAEDLDAAELAAWTSVARVILNLHETITRY
ncbi:PSD1 and planctomycete cytochrome C domain-containing protein [Allorhodopirellula heiligendammensis]|uniref:Planctomycete cytochrome C n=1 Tax=Allorhodopirellula heiligendammensis TaxID=2714739 RepID=A0A5C6C1R6_9BACT|nr:PSD1 and planctomycete cytochrome C domain-containing protein [Allorhodopirellula heiligendammensis]TWU18490.1 Planctomycete cytochrome C [Allorhodopirellula heiligendammensis]